MLTNRVVITGMIEQIRFHHKTKAGKEIFEVKVSSKRLSGTRDEILCWVPAEMFDGQLTPCERVRLKGVYRSTNEIINGKSRLILYVEVDHIEITSYYTDENVVEIYGAHICKQPILRETPLGSRICDLMLAWADDSGKSSYFPCITWGNTAQFTSGLQIGQKVTFIGRLQSRQYTKKSPDGEIEYRIAYEISIGSITVLREDL